MIKKHQTYAIYALGIFLGLFVGGTAFFWNKSDTLEENLAATTVDYENRLAIKSDELTTAESQITTLESALTSIEEELVSLQESYEDELERNDEFENKVENLTDKVRDLDKLTKTDEELLQKYSKVSFLNEHYVPERLREIDDEWKYNEDKEIQLNSKVVPFFEDMLEDAQDDEVELWVVSGYRSFDYQSGLKAQYKVVYGEGANAFSADQGFSEHQLGTAVDFTTRGLGGGLDGFGNTEAYQWLLDNAHKYGFILSYPPDNAYYVFEPWHWRFVGKELADELHDEEQYFYDLDQREIDKYLLKIFD